VQQVARAFGRRWALAGVDLHIEVGSSWMLIGPNGSGKTTLLRCLATELKPHRGKILFGDTDLWTDRASRRRQIGLLAHALHVWEDLSPVDNLRAWDRFGRLEVDVGELLERVGLEARRRDPVRALSAGMKRRLALARLLAKRPQVALLDEPFAAVDPSGIELVLDVIGELSEQGSTVVLATHLPRIGARVCERCARMDKGRKTWEGSSSSLLADLQGAQA